MWKVDRQVTGRLHLLFLRSCFLFLRSCCLLQRIGKLAIPAALRLPLPGFVCSLARTLRRMVVRAMAVWWCDGGAGLRRHGIAQRRKANCTSLCSPMPSWKTNRVLHVRLRHPYSSWPWVWHAICPGRASSAPSCPEAVEVSAGFSVRLGVRTFQLRLTWRLT